jgi:hypothetical protein
MLQVTEKKYEANSFWNFGLELLQRRAVFLRESAENQRRILLGGKAAAFKLFSPPECHCVALCPHGIPWPFRNSSCGTFCAQSCIRTNLKWDH